MKNLKQNKRLIKELASHFEDDFNAKLPIAIQPNGDIVYKDYFIRKTAQSNWALHNLHNGDKVEEFFLKTCALMAAKAYQAINLRKFNEIKYLDNQYRANYMQVIVFRNIMKKSPDFERYQILLNKFELSNARAEHFKAEISQQFKWSFV